MEWSGGVRIAWPASVIALRNRLNTAKRASGNGDTILNGWEYIKRKKDVL